AYKTVIGNPVASYPPRHALLSRRLGLRRHPPPRREPYARSRKARPPGHRLRDRRLLRVPAIAKPRNDGKPFSRLAAVADGRPRGTARISERFEPSGLPLATVPAIRPV